MSVNEILWWPSHLQRLQRPILEVRRSRLLRGHGPVRVLRQDRRKYLPHSNVGNLK